MRRTLAVMATVPFEIPAQSVSHDAAGALLYWDASRAHSGLLPNVDDGTEPAAVAEEDVASFWPPAEPQSLLVLSSAVLQQVLERDALIAAMGEAMRACSRAGGAVVPLRTMMRLPGN